MSLKKILSGAWYRGNSQDLSPLCSHTELTPSEGRRDLFPFKDVEMNTDGKWGHQAPSRGVQTLYLGYDQHTLFLLNLPP